MSNDTYAVVCNAFQYRYDDGDELCMMYTCDNYNAIRRQMTFTSTPSTVVLFGKSCLNTLLRECNRGYQRKFTCAHMFQLTVSIT
jgi:hypothetical protein